MPMVAEHLIPTILASAAAAWCCRPDEKLAARHLVGVARLLLSSKQVI